MGKTSIFLVAAFSLAGARLLYTSQEADVKSAATQGEYEADVIAREIARSAYNSATADIRRYGTDIDQALREFGPSASNCANGKAVCFRRTGAMLDGTYVVEASVDGGNGVDVYAKGTFAYQSGERPVSRTHVINETQTVGVLQVAKAGKLRIQFVDSQAGYCSAIFLQRTLPGLPADKQPGIEMVYSPGNTRNGAVNTGFETVLAPGTQMNFAIGVSTGCTAPTRFPNLVWDKTAKTNKGKLAGKALADALAAYDYRASDWNWTHWALDGAALMNGEPKEAPWGMVETDPTNNQRWRISFEDIPKWNLGSADAGYHNPNLSLWATKHYGYDWSGSFRTPGTDGKGDGWTDKVRVELQPKDACNPLAGYTVKEFDGQADGFHDLRNTGSPADFSDQVIMVEIVDPSDTGVAPGCKVPA